MGKRLVPPLKHLSVYLPKSGEARGFCRKFDQEELDFTTNRKDALKAWLRVNAEYMFGMPIESYRPDEDTLVLHNEPGAHVPMEAAITLVWQRAIPRDKQGRDFASVEVQVTSGGRVLLEGPYMLIVPGKE